MRPFLTASLLAASLLATGACRRSEPASAAVAPAAPAAAEVAAAPADGADDNLNAVLWVQASAEYKAVAETVYRAAADKLDTALAESNWDALVPDERGNAATGLPPAVILDVDETVLDNSPYQARLVLGGREYDEVTWDR